MLLNKTNGKVVGDLMTPAPVVVRETTNLEDSVRYSSPSFFPFFFFQVDLSEYSLHFVYVFSD
jgi:hypothetical protein